MIPLRPRRRQTGPHPPEDRSLRSVRIPHTLGDDGLGVHTRRKLLILAAAVLAPLSMVGVSAAVESDPPADEAPVAEDTHGAAVSAAAQACPTGPEHGPCVREVAKSNTGKDEADKTDEAGEPELDDEVDADDGDGEDAGPPENTHGFAVSTAAKECPEGPEHGPCVREVARDNAGKDDDKAGGPRGRPAELGERGNGGGNGQGGRPEGVGGPRP